MRRSVEMSEISLLIPQRKIDSLIHLLYDLRLVEFFESQYLSLNNIERNDINVESEELVSIRSIISHLKPYFVQMEGSYSNDVANRVYSLIDRKQELEQLQIQVKDSKLRERVKKQLYLTPRKIEQGVVGYVDASKSALIENHKKSTRGVRLYTHQSRTYFYSPISVSFKYKEYFIPVKQSEQSSQKEIEKELNYINKQLTILANANLRHLQAQELKLSKELEVERSKEYFKQSKHHIILQGFVPNKEIHQLDIALKRELADSYEMEVIPANSKTAPVLLPNTGLSKSFESLLSFYSFPKYKEIDPSVIMMLFFPLFFGFILGDFGYGVTSFLFFAFLKYKLPNLKNILNVMQLSAVSSMVFGIIYGEYFGFEPKLFAFEFHRANYPETLLIIALIFGLFHLNLGFLIGIMNSIKHSIKKVFTDYVSWMILQLGALFIYLSMTTSYASLSYVGYGCILLTIVLLYIGHGFQGVIEIPTLFTNIMSYARLMAVGISSIAIAVLINDFSVPLIQSGIVGAIFGITLFTLGHVFNIVLGNFESFLQSLRLHYVEFFSKFYEGGGREFKPFGVKTKEE
ncbi:MAG: V-type ATP synthase subunit I [Candidatus Nanoarchaeia archaeon]